MKLYLADNEKISSYDLPQVVGESFLFSYTSSFTNIEVFLNIYSQNDSWYLRNNGDIEISNGYGDVKLEEYGIYKLKIKGNSLPVYLYAYPTYNNNFKNVNIQNVQQITIGASNENSIVYSCSDFPPLQDTIKLENGVYYIEHNNESPINTYVNGRIVNKKIPLFSEDVIFMNNLKILWMNNYIRIYLNNSPISVSAELQLFEDKIVDNSSYLNYIHEENDKSLYRDDDLFFHKPRLINTAIKEKVEIDAPGPNQIQEDIPQILTIGAGVTAIAYTVVNCFNTYTSYKAGKSTKTEFEISIILLGISIVFTVLFPRLATMYNKHKQKKREKKRQEKYSAYLNKKQEEISTLLKSKADSLYSNYPSSDEAYNIIVGSKERLWEKEISDNDFLSVRVGLGSVKSDIEITAPREGFTIDEDNLLEKAYSIVNNSKIIPNVPITVSLLENPVSSIICNTDDAYNYYLGIIIQILSLHNPNDLKIVFLTSKNNDYKWQFLKLSPHIYSDDKKIRYYSTSEDETTSIINEIENIYNERKNKIKSRGIDDVEQGKEYKSFSPYFLIISDNYIKYKDNNLLNEILSSKTNYGFSILLFDSSLRNVPNECNRYVYLTKESNMVFEKDFNKNNQTEFKPELLSNFNLFRVVRELSNVPIQTGNEMFNLPSSISFLEMCNVGNIEQLGIMNKWSSNNPVLSLQCPIGVHPSGELFRLDLHEKASGPHGLIAGSTGSGKSEFIISYILSMAINYHPDEVQFVIIDYKGGGLAGAFENRETGVQIPHLAGTITNLDVSEMNRSLISINSEVKRRQRKFNEARDKLGESTIDIYKYQKYYREGLLDEPISHLFIISDEFAELKSQQPEFMDELISVSRIGRSLGVHLILATQKPSGVVNDQIWSNSRFKVCLKVQTTSDSQEMLKRPEAASIKEAGRFYLQVGHDELFELGQAAWAGAKYLPSDKTIKVIDDSISFIGNTGEVIKSINALKDQTQVQSKGDQLTNIVKYLNDIAIKNNITPHKLWLDSIPAEIFLNDVIKKYNYQPKPYEIEAVIGEYDNPAKQEQGILKLNITEKGNTLIYGMPGSGKENLITTIVTSICTMHTTDEVMFYVLDFSAETLKKLEKYPQVGDVVFIDEKEKLVNLLSLLNREMLTRKELFAEYMGTYQNYLKLSGKKLPLIVCIIHGYENIVEDYNLEEVFYPLYKDGQKFGINFILTYAISSGLRSKLAQMFNVKIALKLADSSEYSYILDCDRKLIPANYFGRGIAQIDEAHEFQTAYISKLEDINKTIINIAEQLKTKVPKKAPKIPVMPRFFTVDKILNRKYDLSSIPIGIVKDKLSICNYDFTKFNFTPILSSNLSNHLHFLYGLIEILKQVENMKIRVIDVLKLYNNPQGVDSFNKDFDTLTKQIKIEINNDANLKRKNVFIIIGLGALKNNIEEKTKNIFDSIFDKLNTYKNNSFIIFDDYTSYKGLEFEDWFKNIKQSYGIWLGDNASKQLAIQIEDMPLDDKKTTFNQMAYVVKDGSFNIVRYIVDKEFDDEE